MFAVSSFFRRFSFHILGSWFVSPFRRVFSPFRWVFSPFQNRQTHAKWQTYKNCSEAEKHAASNNSWQGNNLAYIGRRRYLESWFRGRSQPCKRASFWGSWFALTSRLKKIFKHRFRKLFWRSANLTHTCFCNTELSKPFKQRASDVGAREDLV